MVYTPGAAATGESDAILLAGFVRVRGPHYQIHQLYRHNAPVTCRRLYRHTAVPLPVMENWDYEIKEQDRFLPLANGT